MKTGVLTTIALLAYSSITAAQPSNRIRFNDQDLFLSGGNIAWVNFATDVGPGATDLNTFERIFRDMKMHGGNAMRFWVHIDGRNNPEWDGEAVVGPGAGTVDDLRAILDLAWKYDVGLLLCLWSHDMLRRSNDFWPGPHINDRNMGILTDTTLTRSYIDNALVPMVDSLSDHPAIIAWEIFNEPEGISHEHGWADWEHVGMSDIQRFVNLAAGAIHRTDPSAQVTNGAWSFIALTDVPVDVASKSASELTTDELTVIRDDISQKYRHNFSLEGTKAFYDGLRVQARNYYTDERLLEAGGDPDGYLDLYTVHYYEWGGTALSPFHHVYSFWELDKPLAVAEFFMGGGFEDRNPNATYGVRWDQLFPNLFVGGYAGALAWQWYNYPTDAEGVVNWPRMLAGMDSLRTLYPEAINVYAGQRIAFFTADPDTVEMGQSALLSWSVSGAASVLVNGTAVDSLGTMTVSPTETTSYTLDFVGREDGTELSETVTVTVVDPLSFNRAFARPTAASSAQRCCGEQLGPELAVDGDLGTRWSSAWDPSEADLDPDVEWLQVELDSAYLVQRVVIQWDTAYAVGYDIEVSFDGAAWTSAYTEGAGDGSVDEITFEDPGAARFVRLHVNTPATNHGYSVWEFEVYGALSSQQPPSVELLFPIEGSVLTPEFTVTLTANATDPDGSVVSVDFLAGGEIIGTATDTPFAVDWEVGSEGDYMIAAVATDDDGIAVSTAPVHVYAVETANLARYEAEDAAHDGLVTVERLGRVSYAYIRQPATLTFEVEVQKTGTYLVVFRYFLPFGFKAQYLNVNGTRLDEIAFDGPQELWLTLGIEAPLVAGNNTIQIESSWGWMYFDYISVGTQVVNVSNEGDPVPTRFALEQNYPNPFGRETTIVFSLSEPGSVALEVFDITGRKVAVLANDHRAAGGHTANLAGASLPAGVYFYRLKAGDQVETRKLLVVK